jgi:hypothetical protein
MRWRFAFAHAPKSAVQANHVAEQNRQKAAHGNRSFYFFAGSRTETHCSHLAYVDACQHLLGVTIAGALFQRHAQSTPGALQQHPNVVPLYVSVIAVEWFLVYGVWAGIKIRGVRLRDLIGGRWKSGRDVLIDIALAIVSWICGANSPVLASTLTSEAQAPRSLGRAEEAAKVEQRLKSIQTSTSNPN